MGGLQFISSKTTRINDIKYNIQCSIKIIIYVGRKYCGSLDFMCGFKIRVPQPQYELRCMRLRVLSRLLGTML